MSTLKIDQLTRVFFKRACCAGGRNEGTKWEKVLNCPGSELPKPPRASLVRNGPRPLRVTVSSSTIHPSVPAFLSSSPLFQWVVEASSALSRRGGRRGSGLCLAFGDETFCRCGVRCACPRDQMIVFEKEEGRGSISSTSRWRSVYIVWFEVRRGEETDDSVLKTSGVPEEVGLTRCRPEGRDLIRLCGYRPFGGGEVVGKTDPDSCFSCLPLSVKVISGQGT
ncbi:hypothetical protein R1sor_016136 [Riccia sorocarpa]|uniref:Uncharacterized protein n=1 Tax=Riccia sorocarpa TaxID=122646 RepID=A0ABD3HGW7_9MARC